MLEICLDAVLSGGQTPEEALARFPEHADRLRPELEAGLEAARWLNEGRASLDPRPGFVRASRGRLLEALDPARRPAAGSLRARLSSFWLGLSRAQLAGRALLALLLLVSLWFSLDRSLQASQTSLPGDSLYAVKLAAENLRLWAAPSAAGEARLHIEFARLRLMELQSLIIEGGYEYVPETVARYESHVDRAVRAVARVSRRDVGEAHALARALQSALVPHTDLVLMFSGGAPQQARAQFERVRDASLNSATELDEMFSPGDGRLENQTEIGAPISWQPPAKRLTDSFGSA
jgi:hypothetical protein